MIKRLLLRLFRYIKYPNQFKADFNTFLNRPAARRLGISFFEPNYIYLDRFSETSIVVDIGCGYRAELSRHLIEKFQVSSFAFDPTLKHEKDLVTIQNHLRGKFNYMKYALASEAKEIEFFETLDHESGSLLTDHKNILNDKIRSYKVKAVTIRQVPEITGSKTIDFIKIDIEGEEFKLLDTITRDDLLPFKQIFIEFHHLSIQSRSYRDTRKIVRKLMSFGLKSFSLDRINYLFYWN